MTNPGDVETVERVIPAPAEKIFDLIADPRRHPDIDGSGTVRKSKDGPERLALGSRFGMSMKLGVPYSMVSEVIEFEDGRRIAWQSRPPGPIGARLAGGAPFLMAWPGRPMATSWSGARRPVRSRLPSKGRY